MSDRSITSTLPGLDSTRQNVLLLDIFQTFFFTVGRTGLLGTFFICGSYRYIITHVHISGELDYRTTSVFYRVIGVMVAVCSKCT
jgi:hypothetical protein